MLVLLVLGTLGLHKYASRNGQGSPVIDVWHVVSRAGPALFQKFEVTDSSVFTIVAGLLLSEIDLFVFLRLYRLTSGMQFQNPFLVLVH